MSETIVTKIEASTAMSGDRLEHVKRGVAFTSMIASLKVGTKWVTFFEVGGETIAEVAVGSEITVERDVHPQGARDTGPHHPYTEPENKMTIAVERNEMLAKEKWQVRTIAVLEKVFAERLEQVKRYGHNENLEDGTGPNEAWLAPYTEDAAWRIEGELRGDYEEYEETHGKPTWKHLVREEIAEAFQETSPDRLEEELIQVAALCTSWVEKIQRRRDEDEGLL